MQFLGSLAACVLLLISCQSSSAFVAHRISSSTSLRHHRGTLLNVLNVPTTPSVASPFNMTHHSPINPLLEFPPEALHNDYYSGVAIHVQEFDQNLATNPARYSKILESSLELWKMEQRRGIWIHIPKSHGQLIAVRLSCCVYCTTTSLLATDSHILPF